MTIVPKTGSTVFVAVFLPLPVFSCICDALIMEPSIVGPVGAEPGHINARHNHVLVALERKMILIPAICSLEIANAVLVGESKKTPAPAM